MKELDPILHSQLRLAVMSILMNVDEADFVYLKEKTESTAGNLSVQLDNSRPRATLPSPRGLSARRLAPPARLPTRDAQHLKSTSRH